MHSVIFVATVPKEAIHDWGEFLGLVADKLRPLKGVQRLGENVWLLDLTKSTASLGWLISTAERKGVAYGLLPFEREPQWLPAGFDPKTKQENRL